MYAVAFDTETRGLDWWDPSHRAFLASWADEAGEYTADLAVESEATAFRSAIERADVVIGHNLKFDVHHVRAALGFNPIEGKTLHDTDLMSRVLYPSGAGDYGAHKLKNLAAKWLDPNAHESEDAIKEMGKSIGLRTLKQTGAYYDVYRAYPDVMRKYAAMDARYTYDLWVKFSAELAGSGRVRVYALEMACLPVLLRAEEHGIGVDPVVVAQLADEYSTAHAEVRAKIVNELGESALGGPDALADALIEYGVPLHKRTATGKIATHKFALQEFEDAYPIIADLEDERRLSRFLTTYVGAVDGRTTVHTSFNPCGAWTGRMSTTRPSMQNWPKRAGKQVRSMIVPRPGCALVVADYESIEARLLAYYLGDPGYRKLIDDGHDPHAWMAALIHGGQMADYAKGTAGEPLRSIAKNTTFAICYGAGAGRVAAMNKMPTDEARDLIRKVKSNLPGYWTLTKRIRQKVEAVGHVNTIMGRKQPVRPDKSYVGLNALIQGSAADICKAGVVRAATLIEPLGATLELVVHDELVVECPQDRADECLTLVKQGMIEPGAELGLSPSLSVEGSWTTESYAHA